MSLRLAWAGPWNERSAIAFFGTLVANEMVALGHEVEVFRTEVGDDLLLPVRRAPGPVHTVDEQSLIAMAGDFDGVIVNLGNHYGFHGGAIPVLRGSAPLIILHDAWLGHFCDGWRVAAGNDGWRTDQFLRDDPSGISSLCALASGVIVHGPHYREAAEMACPGPVAMVPLAYTADALPPPRPTGDRLIVATVGHVNGNKRADEVIRALGASERLRDCVLYVLAGPVEPDEQARLIALARQVGAREPHFTGWLPDELLRLHITGADVMCCLRYPAWEGGSASMITAMLSGRPTLVSNHASYADVPDGLVLKCSPGHEATDVRKHLEALLDDPAGARVMGDRARAYALRTFAPAAYAARLLDVLQEATLAEPAIRTGRLVGRRLAEFGMKADDPAVDRMDTALADLLHRTR